MTKEKETKSEGDDGSSIHAAVYFGPGDIEVFEADGIHRLTLPGQCTYLSFSAVLTHPFSLPEEYISLRDGNFEIGIIRDLREFDVKTQKTMHELLSQKYYIPRITRIITRKELFGGNIWEVETNHGPRRLVTRGIYESMWQMSSGNYFIQDIDGNRYQILIDEMPEEDAVRIREMI